MKANLTTQPIFYLKQSKMFQFKIGKWLEKAMKFSRKTFLQKNFHGHVECCFDNPAGKFWTKSPTKFDSKSENDWKKNLFLWKNFFLSKRSSGLIESSCDRPSEMFLLEVRNQQIRSSILTKTFLKMFSLTRKVHFLEGSWKFFVNVRAIFAQNLKKIKEFSSLQGFFFQKKPYELVECKYGNPEEISSTEGFNVSIQNPKIKKKAVKFSKNCFSSRKRFFGRGERNLDNPPEICWPEVLEDLVLTSKGMGKNIFLEKDSYFFSKRCSGPIESKFDKPFGTFLIKVSKLTNPVLKPRKKFPEGVLLDTFYAL